MSVEDFLASVKKKSVERTFSRGTSKYRGVAIAKNGKWRADIWVKGKVIGLGRFDKEEEAAAAYDAALIERDGPGALTNAAFPLGFSEQALKANFRLQAQRRQEVEVKDDEEAADDDEVEGNGLPPEGWTFFNHNLMFLREEDLRISCQPVEQDTRSLAFSLGRFTMLASTSSCSVKTFGGSDLAAL